MTVVGTTIMRLTATPPPTATSAAERFARQVLLIERDGQAILRGMTVAVIGVGGGGSLLVQSLAHLGVGHIIALDFDRVSPSNLSRIVGSESADGANRPLKIDVMKRLVQRIDPTIQFIGIDGDVTYVEDARRVANSDFVFLATDTMFARYAFNLVVHQYLVPGILVGAKVTADSRTGSIDHIHIAERMVLPESGCLECSRSIDHERLRWEQLNVDERRAQRYIDDAGEDIEDPAVITFNSISTSLATTDFLLMATGLLPAATQLAPLIYYPFERELRVRPSTPRGNCPFCDTTSPMSAFGRGDSWPLSLRPGRRLPAEPAEPAAKSSPWARLRSRLEAFLIGFGWQR